jgi:hypothetical protein
MQRSEYPSDLFAGLAETDPPFLWPGDTVGIALTVVAASCSPIRRTGPRYDRGELSNRAEANVADSPSEWPGPEIPAGENYC